MFHPKNKLIILFIVIAGFVFVMANISYEAQIILGDLEITVYKPTETYNLPPELGVSYQKEWSDWSFCSINYSGDIVALIDPQNGNVVSINLNEQNLKVISPHSKSEKYVSLMSEEELITYRPVTFNENDIKRKNEVALPVAVSHNNNDQLFISDSGNRRIIQLDNDENLKNTVQLPDNISAPNDIRQLPNGNILLSGLIADYKNGLQSGGNYCTILSPQGEKLKSFAYTPQIVYDSNLWAVVSSVIDVDDNGNIYQTFNVENIVRVYDDNGNFIREFNYYPVWFKTPEKISEKTILSNNSEQIKLMHSWTRIVKILYVGEGKLIVIGESNGSSMHNKKRFFYTMVSTNGKVLHSLVKTNEFPFGRDKNNNIYFLDTETNKIIKCIYQG